MFEIESKQLRQEADRPRALVATVRRTVQRMLAGTEASPPPISPAMAEIAEAAGASCIFVLGNGPRTSSEFPSVVAGEWRPDRDGPIDAPRGGALDWEAPGYSEWARELQQGRPVQCVRSDAPAAVRESFERRKAASVLLLPIAVEGRWWGALGLEDGAREREWPSDDVEALRLVADVLGVHVARGALQARLRIERDLASDLLALESVDDALPRCLDAAMLVSGTDCGAIYLYDAGTGALRLACHENLSDGFVQAVAEAPAAALLARIAAPGAALANQAVVDVAGPVGPLLEQEGMRAMAVIPVVSQGHVIATINVGSRTLQQITPEQCVAVEAVAKLIGNAVVRLRAEEELAAHERDLRSLFDSVGDLLFVLDAEGRYAHVNQATVDTLGYSRDEIVGQPASLVRPPESIETGRATLRAAWETGAAVCHLPLVARDGTHIPSETLFTRGVWSGRPVLMGVTRDVCERQRIEEQQRVLARFATRLAGVPDSDAMVRVVRDETDALFGWDAHYFAVLDPHSGGLRVLAFVDTVDGERKDFPGTDWSEDPPRPMLGLIEGGQPVLINRTPGADNPPLSRFGDEDRPSASLMAAPVLSGDRLIGIISVQSYTHGRYDADDLDLLLRMAGIIAPALERANAQAALRESEERYRTIFDTSPEAIVLIDRDGAILDANALLYDCLGLNPETAIGRNIVREPLALDLDPELIRANLEARLAGADVPPYRVEFVDGQGQHRTARLVGAPFGGASGEVSGAVYMLSDTTEQEQLEERVREAQRLQSLTVLAGGVAHDFNNILTGVMGSVDLAMESLDDDAPARPHVERIAESARRLAKVSEQMLFYSGHSVVDPEPVCISAIVEGVADLLGAMRPDDVELALQLAPDAPRVRADAQQISQALTNAVVNAVEALDGGPGTVTIRTGAVALSDADLLGVQSMGRRLQPGDYACIEVIDTGAGMDEATRARMFEPFFSTKFAGRGLGLAATLGIVCGHGGGVDVVSAPGGGTTVRILVPAIAPGPAVSASPTQTAVTRSRSAGGGAILIADDEPSVLETARLGLESAGYEVLAAADGMEAVEVVARAPNSVSAVILDMTMPRLSGQEALEKLRQLSPDIPVVLMSGFDEATIAGTFGEVRPTAFLQKPFRLAELLRTMREALGAEADAPD